MTHAPNNATWLTDQILIVRHVFTPDECVKLIAMAEEEYGFEPASVRTHSGQQMRPDIRNNERIVFTNTELADEMWRRIKDHLPSHAGSHPTGVDPSLRVYKYAGTQRFKRHKDGAVTNAQGETSRYSYLLYLNDDFTGGETVFTFVSQVAGDRHDETLPVRPETGMAMLFIHDQWHEGLPLTHGVKYVLRTDVFFG